MYTTTVGTTVALEVNGVPLQVDTRFRWMRGKLLTVALVVLALLLLPRLAIAAWWDSPAEGMLHAIAENVSNIGKSVETSNNFTHLVASGGAANALYTTAVNFARTVVWSSAVAVLSLSFLLQLMKVAQRIDGNAAMPALKEVLMLAVTFTICVWVLSNSFHLTRDFYDLINSWSRSISVNLPDRIEFEITDSGALDTISLIIPFILSYAVCFFGQLVVQVMFTARALQIYLYAAFSPLMLSMFMVDELRPWAMGFVKGFLACCLSGIVMVFALSAFPDLLASFIGGAASTTNGVMSIAVSPDSTNWLIGVVASVLAVAGLCLKSGSFAREILGG